MRFAIMTAFKLDAISIKAQNPLYNHDDSESSAMIMSFCTHEMISACDKLLGNGRPLASTAVGFLLIVACLEICIASQKLHAPHSLAAKEINKGNKDTKKIAELNSV